MRAHARSPMILEKHMRSEQKFLKKNSDPLRDGFKSNLNSSWPCIWMFCHHLHRTSVGTRAWIVPNPLIWEYSDEAASIAGPRSDPPCRAGNEDVRRHFH